MPATPCTNTAPPDGEPSSPTSTASSARRPTTAGHRIDGTTAQDGPARHPPPDPGPVRQSVTSNDEVCRRHSRMTPGRLLTSCQPEPAPLPRHSSTVPRPTQCAALIKEARGNGTAQELQHRCEYVIQRVITYSRATRRTGPGDDLDLAGPQTVLARWHALATIAANPLTADEQAQLQRAKNRDLTGAPPANGGTLGELQPKH
jgi:hypothetical protein